MARYLHLKDPPNASLDEVAAAFTDVTGAETVQVQIDYRRKVLHVNVNGVCLLRICRIGKLSAESILQAPHKGVPNAPE